MTRLSYRFPFSSISPCPCHSHSHSSTTVPNKQSADRSGIRTGRREDKRRKNIPGSGSAAGGMGETGQEDCRPVLKDESTEGRKGAGTSPRGTFWTRPERLDVIRESGKPSKGSVRSIHVTIGVFWSRPKGRPLPAFFHLVSLSGCLASHPCPLFPFYLFEPGAFPLLCLPLPLLPVPPPTSPLSPRLPSPRPQLIRQHRTCRARQCLESGLP